MPIDYKRYPKGWRTRIVPAVLQRAGNMCEVCGLVNYQRVWSVKLYVRGGEEQTDKKRYAPRTLWFRDERDARREHPNPKSVRVVLTVAHLDHDEENHHVQLDRLQAMCQLCHLRYDAKEKYRRAFNGTYAKRNHGGSHE